jgi:hypothetical protein
MSDLNFKWLGYVRTSRLAMPGRALWRASAAALRSGMPPFWIPVAAAGTALVHGPGGIAH